MLRNSLVKVIFVVSLLWQLLGMAHLNHFIGDAIRELSEEPQLGYSLGGPLHKTKEQESSTANETTKPDGSRFNPSLTNEGQASSTERKNLEDSDTPEIHTRVGGKPGNITTTDSIIYSTESSSSFSATKEKCFGSNSDKWIAGNISSNNHDGITPELLDTLMEGPAHFQKLPWLFDQTICHQDSPLRNFSPQNPGDRDSTDYLASVENWYHRFFYLALHWKFHRPALDEYRSRKSCAEMDARDGSRSLESFMDHHGIGMMDFECKDAKFVIIPMGSIGFGAFLNTQATLNILLALHTNRIPIFSSRSYFSWQKRNGKQDPWLLAPSTCSRKDMQCYFLPTTPCAVTDEDIENAPLYGATHEEQKFLGTSVTIPPELEKERIVVLNPGLSRKSADTPGMRKIVHEVVTELLGEWRKAQSEYGDSSWSDQDWEAINLAHQWIIEKTKKDPVGLLRQVYVYMLRPNPHYKDLLEKQMSTIRTEDMDPSETVGLAIRGSDKCKSESTCLPFDRYMELATDVAYPGLSYPRNISSAVDIDPRPKLIVTTEDPKIYNESLVYQRNSSFPFQFLVNENDNMQGSGYPKDFASTDREKTIVSSLTALKFHFNAGKVYLNCCSNFHVVLKLLLHGQCGARRHGHDFVFGNYTDDHSSPAPPPVAQCLSEPGIPRRYQICCSWSKKTATCGPLWKEYIMEKEKNNLLVKDKYGGVAIVG